nr:MAG TPA: hypothetical protein [Caudoviricetes sp.]
MYAGVQTLVYTYICFIPFHCYVALPTERI